MWMVLAYHYLEPVHRNAPGVRHYLLAPARIGWIGIDLFFVMSGFLIASILITNRESPSFFRTFYLRRFCRVLPLYLVVLAGCYWVHLLVSRKPGPPLWMYLTFTQNFWMAAEGRFGVDLLGVTWSLAVEEQFYLLLPLLVRFNPSKRLLAIIIGCIFLAPVMRYFFVAKGGQPAMFAAHVLLVTHLDALMLGVLVAWMRVNEIAIPRRLTRIVWALSSVFVLYTSLQRPVAGVEAPPSMVVVFFVAITLFCTTTVIIALEGGFRFLRWRFLTYTGIISYAIYLFHMPLNWAVHLKLRWKDWTDVRPAMLSTVLVFILAALSWELFEKRFVRYGHRFQYEPPEKEKGAALAAPEGSTQTGS